MSLQFEISNGGCVPEGLYKAKFATVETTDHDEYGAGLRFVFDVTEGEHVGEQATRVTSAKPTLKNAAGRMISSITGASLQPGGKIDLAPFVGRVYMLQIESTPSGATRIATCMSADA